MATQTLTCTGCGKSYEVDVSDESIANNEQVAWECPDYQCSTKNFTEGRTPAEIALNAVMAPTDPDVVMVTDADIARSGDLHQ